MSFWAILLKLWHTTTHFASRYLRDCTSCFQMKLYALLYFSFLWKLHLMLKKSPTKCNEKPQQNPTHRICFTGSLYKTNLFSDDSLLWWFYSSYHNRFPDLNKTLLFSPNLPTLPPSWMMQNCHLQPWEREVQAECCMICWFWLLLSCSCYGLKC